MAEQVLAKSYNNIYENIGFASACGKVDNT